MNCSTSSCGLGDGCRLNCSTICRLNCSTSSCGLGGSCNRRLGGDSSCSRLGVGGCCSGGGNGSWDSWYGVKIISTGFGSSLVGGSGWLSGGSRLSSSFCSRLSCSCRSCGSYRSSWLSSSWLGSSSGGLNFYKCNRLGSNSST